MKNLIYVVVILLLSQTAGAQNSDTAEISNEEVLTYADEMPSWKGCENFENEKEKNSCTHNKIVDYVINEISYPDAAKKANTEGIVYVSFIIDKSGKVINSKILRGVSPEIDEEAIRIVSSMPDWNPGYQNEKAVNVAYNLPIRFTLNKNQDSEKK